MRPSEHPSSSTSSRPGVAATHHLVRMAAAVASATPPQLEQVMREALPHADPVHVDELLLQSYLFAGFPRTLNALSAWRQLSGQTAPSVDDEADIRHVPEWAERGDETCRTVYGGAYHALRRNIRALHPAIDLWMVVDGYGKVLSRPGLDLVTRELCIVAVCMATQQRPQLRSHLLGALNCGATLDDLERTYASLTDLLVPDAVDMAREQFARLTAFLARTNS